MPYDPYSGEEIPESAQNAPEAPAAPGEAAPYSPYQSENYDPYAGTPEEPAQTAPGTENFQAHTVYKNPRSGKRGFVSILLALIVLVLLAVFVPRQIFKLKSVRVIALEESAPLLATAEEGTVLQEVYLKDHTYNQIAGLSDLVQGQNMLAITEEQIISALGRDYTLMYKGMKKDYGNRTISLYIAERQPIAAYRRLGMVYLLDAQGMVMGERELEAAPEGMPVILGFSVSGVNVGQMLSVSSAAQMDAFRAIMKEMKADDGILEVNLKDPADLYLETRDKITVRLGSAEYMHAKLAAYRVYLSYLRQMNTAGMLDLTVPEDADFRPEK